MNPETKQRIQSTFKRYHRPACLADDPLCVVRMFAQPADWEMAGLVAAVLAYGRVEQIIAALNRIFEATGKNLSARNIRQGKKVICISVPLSFGAVRLQTPAFVSPLDGAQRRRHRPGAVEGRSRVSAAHTRGHAHCAGSASAWVNKTVSSGLDNGRGNYSRIAYP